jgi:hypothetical protein
MASIIGSLGQIGASIIGSGAAGADQAQANADVQNAINAVISTGMPPNMAQQVILQQYAAAGKLTPQMEQTINATFQQINPNQAGMNAQMQALQQLQQVSQTGQTAAGRLALQQAQTAAGRQNEAQQNAVIQDMAQRGEAGSGAELAARLSAAQNNANQLSQSSNQVAANVAQNALGALSASGSLGGQIQGEQTGLAAQNAQIANLQQQFNTQNQLAIQQQNVQAQNQAQAQNLANQQALANANVSQANTEAERELQGQMQTYQATQGQNQLVANAYLGGAQNARYNAGQTQQTAAGIGSAIGDIGAGLSTLGGSTPSSSGSSGNTNVGSQGLGVDTTMPTMSPLNFSNPTPSSDYNSFLSGSGTSTPIFWQGGMDFKEGGHVPGKAKVSGNSPKNDTVDAKLSPGELVISREALKSPEATAKFINDRLGFNLQAGKK